MQPFLFESCCYNLQNCTYKIMKTVLLNTCKGVKTYFLLRKIFRENLNEAILLVETEVTLRYFAC